MYGELLALSIVSAAERVKYATGRAACCVCASMREGIMYARECARMRVRAACLCMG